MLNCQHFLMTTKNNRRVGPNSRAKELHQLTSPRLTHSILAPWGSPWAIQMIKASAPALILRFLGLTVTLIGGKVAKIYGKIS